MVREKKGIARTLSLGIGAALAFAMLGSACVVHDDDDGCYDCYYGGPPPDQPVLVTIDADYTLSTELGYGASVFVEYTRGGTWTVWTSCDTDKSGYYCYWDVYVTSHGFVDTIDLYDTEGWDGVDVLSDSSFMFHAETGSFSDTAVFTTAPGELVEIVAYLDGVAVPDHIVWHGNGLVHDWRTDLAGHANGVTSQPVIFQPDAP